MRISSAAAGRASAVIASTPIIPNERRRVTDPSDRAAAVRMLKENDMSIVSRGRGLLPDAPAIVPVQASFAVNRRPVAIAENASDLVQNSPPGAGMRT